MLHIPSAQPAPEPGSQASLILDAISIERVLKRIAHEIVERNDDLHNIALIGIPLRGVEIAKRLATYIEQFEGTHPFTGVVDVSLYRDDLHTRRIPPRVERTDLPHDLENTTIILTDDVLYSGRTCRAAMESILNFGRPARIQYAVLVDRGHRELPIRADYVGKNVPTSRGERVHVRFQAVDGTSDGVWLSKPEATE